MTINDFRAVFAIPLVFFFLFVGVGATQPYIVPYLKSQFRLGPLQCTLILAVVYFVFGISRFFVGYVINYLQKKMTIMLGAAGYLLFVILLCFSRSYSLLVVGGVMWGIAAALLWTASSTQVLDTSVQEKYGKASGVLMFFTKSGIAIGTIVLGLALAGSFSYEELVRFYVRKEGAEDYTAFFWTSISMGALGVLLTFLIPDVKGQVMRPNLRFVIQFFSRAEGWLVPMILFVAFFAYGLVLSLFNQFLKEEWGLAYVMPITATFMWSGVLWSFVSGWLSDRVGRGPVLVSCFALGSLSLFILAAAPTPFVAAIAAFMLGIQFGGIPAVATAWVGDKSTPEERPMVHACAFAWRDMGAVISMLLSGVLLQRGWSFDKCFLCFGTIFLVPVFVSILLLKFGGSGVRSGIGDRKSQTT